MKRLGDDSEPFSHQKIMHQPAEIEEGFRSSEPFSVPGTGHADSAKSIEHSLEPWWIVKVMSLDPEKSHRKCVNGAPGNGMGDVARGGREW